MGRRALVAALLLALAPAASAEETGEAIFLAEQCGACHGFDGARRAGPDLAGLFGRRVVLADGGSATADEAYVREAILRPAARVVKGYPPVMPAYEGRLPPERLEALLAFLRGR